MAASEIVIETERKIQSLTSSSDVTEDMAIVMTPHSNWEEYIMPAPLSIAIIGTLIISAVAKMIYRVSSSRTPSFPTFSS